MKKKSTQAKQVQLDEDEQELENNFASLMSATTKKEEKTKKMLQLAAKDYPKKGKRITIRVYESDLERIKKMAVEEGLPYQTFITSVLHKLSTGNMCDCRHQVQFS
ncbi:MAG: hypothetical protein A2X78_00045 [Gammaproteobacteria bacterium GWE2_37_16]|nr:MAG: hypothetical protein A2X78_00045 [Gammaproteobacteria bacterium GWE2_37_16]